MTWPAVLGVRVEALLALALGALAGGADVHHQLRALDLLGERERARVERVRELLVVLGDHARAGAAGAVELDQLDVQQRRDLRHRAVQLGGEAAADAAGPVGDLHAALPSVSGAVGLSPPPSVAVAPTGTGVLLDLVVAGDVEVQLVALGAGLDLVVDPLHALQVLGGDLVAEDRDLRVDFSAQQALDRDGQRGEQLFAGGGMELAEPRVAAIGARHHLGLVQQAVVLDQADHRGLVALAVVFIDDLLIVDRDPPQAHDLAHRVDALGAGLDALEAVRAVEDPLRIFGEVLQADVLLVVARVADEAVGLCERRRADEAGVDLHRQAVRDAGAALDAGHRLGDVDHRLFLDQVLALGHRLLGDQPRRDALHLLPVHGVHVDDQVLDHRHVAHRLDLDHAVGAGPSARVVQMGVAGEARFAVDPHPARAADRRAAGAADPDRSVGVGFRLEDPLEHRAVGLELDRVLVPVGRVAGLGVEAAQPEGELLRRLVRFGHQYFLSSGSHWVIVTGE